MDEKLDPLTEDLIRAKVLLDKYKLEMAKRIVGQDEMIEGLLTAILAGGHCLLEGPPGLAKTLAVKTLAGITGLSFKRVQFTPDLLPADLTGTLVWEQAANSFSIRRGPIFANIILADEINRAPAKVQSALLEAMEEGQVTIGENSLELPGEFFVLATQNPIEHEGTYPLPEAQLDRFMLKLIVRYPQADEELRILRMNSSFLTRNEKEGEKRTLIIDESALKKLRLLAEQIHVDETVERYMVAVVGATRPPSTQNTMRPETAALKAGKESVYRYVSFGASPRAVLALHRCSKIAALFAGNSFVKPEDVKKAAIPVLRHRLVLSYEAEASALDADTIISRILSFVPVP
ncbi:MAG: AAA family ATPase [Spirochaetaceae bacterium]|jgi:MoxR-like ATPase|nr:AAA family ATPase [Spirochaetaceae bacterium]